MSTKNKGLLGNLIWYASGSNLKDLANSSRNFTDYIGIGGLNIFSTISIGLISSWASSKFFATELLALHLIVGVIMSVLVFSINRQTIKALNIIGKLERNKRNIFTLFPLYLFSFVVGLVISFPVKFYVFSIEFISNKHNILQTLTELDSLTDSNINSKLISWVVSLILIVLISIPTLIKYYSISNNLQRETSSMLNEFMWFCSGANKDIVRKCPNEHSKYFGIGGTILFTSLMASLSGGYAITTVFKDVSVGICFGIFWGALIFNLDRFIVNTMYSDGKHTISKEEILGGLPRLVIAIFLGIVISYPIELKIFETEINYSMRKMAIERSVGIGKEVDSTVKTMSTQNANLSKNISEYNIQISKMESKIYNYTPKTIKKRKVVDEVVSYYNITNPQYALFKKQQENEISKIRNIKNQLESQNTKMTGLITNATISNDSTKNMIRNELGGLKGLSTRMRAFSELKENEPSTEIASIFIMLLFIIIEISPVLFKMMMSAGDYDLILKTEKDKIRTHEMERLSRLNDWANTEIQKVVEENKMKVLQKQAELNAEFKANEVLLNSIAEAQVELSKIAVKKWKEQELNKIEKDPNYFIQSVANTQTTCN